MKKSWKDTRLRFKPETWEKYRKNAMNRSKQKYTHIGGSKSLARRREEDGGESVEESYGPKCTKEKMVHISMMKQEELDESSRVLSQNNLLAQVFRKEKLDRVRGMHFGPTPSQLFDSNSHPSSNGVQVEEIQRNLFELQPKLEAEKLKRKAMEDEATTEKKKRQAIESDIRYLFQQ
ncbi:hypothetical protein Ahy_B03g066393 [Arachis hypogaea]|uniref:Uncharacterized protein n=1 Tax=Arachis hypogaea TaxID=3818 RepID=A0A445A453_ARAHY|nr:hypothetical protein Ahy_B03g066393 [Arachis hypogaea]